MKTLVIATIAFFTAFGGAIAYFATSGPGHEYDLKHVLAIDVRNMPQPAVSVLPPRNDSSLQGDAQALRAEAAPNPEILRKTPFRFEEKPGGANDLRAHE